MQKWNPLPQDLAAGLNKVTWSPACPAPELVAYAWTFQQLNLGDVVSVRDVAAYAGWGKTKAQRLLARAREDWAGWNPTKEVPQHESCRTRKGSGQARDSGGTAAGEARDSGGTAAGQVEPDGAGIVEPPRDTDGTAAGQEQGTDGTAAGQRRDDRAPDLLVTPTQDTSPPPTPPAGGGAAGQEGEAGSTSGDEPREAGAGPQQLGPQGCASPGQPLAAVPSWLPRRMPERLDGAAFGSTVLDCIETITGRRPDLEETDAQHKPVVELWMHGRQRTTDMHGLLRDVALVATWARFAGVPGAASLRHGRDERKVAAICDYRKWAGRLMAAREWAKQAGWTWDGRAWVRVGGDDDRARARSSSAETSQPGWAARVLEEAEHRRPDGCARDSWTVACAFGCRDTVLGGSDLALDVAAVVQAATKHLSKGAA